VSTAGNYRDEDTDRYDGDEDWGDFAMQSADQFLEAQADRDYRRHCDRVHGGQHCNCSVVGANYTEEAPF
jgi:hypothetical protein